MDAGGLAQMTYNPSFSNGGLGVPNSGFGSRGKGSHIKRLSVPPPIDTIDEAQQSNVAPAPRTSRSHLLAGLRTAPKSAQAAPPSFSQQQQQQQNQQRFGIDNSGFGNRGNFRFQNGMPQTAIGAAFPQEINGHVGLGGFGQQMYSMPEQILAPPAIQISDEEGEDHIDPNLYAELVATNLYLAQQQQRLQQQLINVTSQYQALNGQTGYVPQQGFYQPSVPSQLAMSAQQLQSQIQPIVSPVPGRPGLYSVYDQLTGQVSYAVDNSFQNPAVNEVEESTYRNVNRSSPPPLTPTFQAQITPPPLEASTGSDNTFFRESPKSTPSPTHDIPEREAAPTTGSFRRGHKKSLSFAAALNADLDTTRPITTKSGGYPQTPLTGTFGPGQHRAGEHPVRQPRGPPPLEELIAKPTSKCEGSKNFATRQRRRAVHNLVRAGKERRSGAHGVESGSAGTSTPASDVDVAYASVHSDSESLECAKLSSESSIASLRSSTGAIGSERKARSKDRGSVDSQFTSASLSSDESTYIGGRLMEIKLDENKACMPERRNTPMMVLSRAAKRKSSMF